MNASENSSSNLLKARLKTRKILPSLEEILFAVNGKAPLLIEVKTRGKKQDIWLITSAIFDGCSPRSKKFWSK